MTRREKLLEKARNNPRGLRFSELTRLAESYGFYLDRQGGSHAVYKHKGLGVSIPLQPDKNGKAKGYQVKQLLDAIATISEEE